MAVFDFDQFPVLETARLILRQVKAADAEAIFRFRSDPEVCKYNGLPFETIDEAHGLIGQLQRQFEVGSTLAWGMRLKDEADTIIGLCGFNYWSRYNYLAEIGFDMAKAYWGKGLMPEAADVLVRFGFERMALNKIVAEVRGDNRASIRVMEKLGFKLEGVLRQQTYENGQFCDEMLFGMLSSEFQQPGT